MPRRTDDRAGPEQWAQDVANLCHQAELVTAQSTANIRYHRDRVQDDKKAREALLSDYARLQKIEENCFGGRRVIPRFQQDSPRREGDVKDIEGATSPASDHHLHRHDASCGKHCTKEHHLPQLPLSARGVQAAKYRLRERAEQKRFKEEQVLLAREAERRLRQERLQAAKSRFRDNGHVSNVLASFFEAGNDSESQRATSPNNIKDNTGASPSTPRKQITDGNIDSNSPNGTNGSYGYDLQSSTQHPLVASSPHQKQLIITATLLATSGLPPDILKTGAAAIKNLVAGAQILLLSRQSVCMVLETRVEPLLTKLARCNETRRRYVPEGENAYQDPVDNALTAAICSINEDKAKLVAQKVELEDLVAYVDGLRKTIAARLPSVGGGESGPKTTNTNNNASATITTANASTNAQTLMSQPQMPLPQVTAEQPQPPTMLNLVALAKGKRRRIPLQDTQAAIIAAGHAYHEAISASDAAHSIVRAVKGDLHARMGLAMTSLSGKVRDNKALQKSIVAQIEMLEQQVAALDAFVSEHKLQNQQTISSPSSNTNQTVVNNTSPALHASANGTAGKGPHAPVARGAGVVIPSTTTALKHIHEDKAKLVKVLDQLKRNLADKRALEVIDVEVLRVLAEGGKEHGHHTNPNLSQEHSSRQASLSKERLGKEIQRKLRGYNDENMSQRSSRPQSQQRESPISNDFLADNIRNRCGSQQSDTASSRRRIPAVPTPPASPSTRHSKQKASQAEGSFQAHKIEADVDDLLSGRGSVSTRSAKVKAMTSGFNGVERSNEGIKEVRIPAPPKI